jgi:enamine deaminase RidA (YjgF/YER057c/UK114 family)
MSHIERRIAELGLSLPEQWQPRGMFLPWRMAGNIIYLSGQICERNGAVVLAGPVGNSVSTDEARAAAEICALNLLYNLKQACGDLDRVTEIIRLGGFVNCVPQFPDAPKVVDGASELFIKLYGEAGRHVRTAVGVAGLPANAAVEVDAIVRVGE